MPGAVAASAAGAFKAVVLRVHPPQPYLGLEIPVASEHPAVAVGNTCAGHPALVAVRAQHAEIIAENVARESEVAYIVLAAEQVHAEEMAAQGFAEPISRLRLHEPMLPSASVAHIPSVEITR